MSQLVRHYGNLWRVRPEEADEPPDASMAPEGAAISMQQRGRSLPPASFGCVVLLITWLLLEVMLDRRLVDEWTVTIVLLACSLFAVVLLLADPVRRFAGILWAFLLAYFSAAYVARYAFGLSYFPFVSDDVFDPMALAGMRAFGLSFIVLFPLLRERWCRSCAAAYSLALDQVAATSRRKIQVICAILAALGLVDWLAVANVGLGAIAESGRRSFSADLILASNHNIQVVAIPITILALIRAWQGHDRWMWIWVTVCVGFAWLPCFIVGSRKEIFLICLAFLPIMLVRPVSPAARWLLIGATVVFILIPILFDGNVAMGFHEVILPFYNVVSLHVYSDYLSPTGTFLSGVQLLLPSFLRITDARVFGSDIADLMTALGQNVSYGGHPYAEAMAFGGQQPAIMLLVSNGILLGACIILARIRPIFMIIAFPYLVLWGRSILWVTLFFILYGGLVLILLAERTSRAHLERVLPGRPITVWGRSSSSPPE